MEKMKDLTPEPDSYESDNWELEDDDEIERKPKEEAKIVKPAFVPTLALGEVIAKQDAMNNPEKPNAVKKIEQPKMEVKKKPVAAQNFVDDWDEDSDGDKSKDSEEPNEDEVFEFDDEPDWDDSF